jgi:hypothetical protein
MWCCIPLAQIVFFGGLSSHLFFQVVVLVLMMVLYSFIDGWVVLFVVGELYGLYM